jgi:hypothetical protein
MNFLQFLGIFVALVIAAFSAGFIVMNYEKKAPKKEITNPKFEIGETIRVGEGWKNVGQLYEIDDKTWVEDRGYYYSLKGGQNHIAEFYLEKVGVN